MIIGLREAATIGKCKPAAEHHKCVLVTREGEGERQLFVSRQLDGPKAVVTSNGH